MSDAFLQAAVVGLIGTSREFLYLTWNVLPYFLVGAVVGAGLQAFLPRTWSDRLFGGTGLRSLLMAVGTAALLPGCSCATMPMASGLRDTGAPRLGTTTAFIFMSPLLSPITVTLTWAMLGWRMTVARVVVSFAGSIALGIVVNRFESWFAAGVSPGLKAASNPGGNPPCGSGSCETTAGGCGDAGPVEAEFWSSLWAILRNITPYFLLGMGIAAVLSALLPEEAIPRYLGGSSGVWAYFLAALVGIPIYVCEGEEVPITFALLARGLGPGPALTFLLGSVGTCIPTVLMSRNIIGRRATIVYTAFWFLFSIGSGRLFQNFLT